MSHRVIRFTDVVRDVSGGNSKLPQSSFQESGRLAVVDQGKEFIAGYTDDLSYCFQSEPLPVVVFGDHTKAVKYIDFPFAMGADGVKVLKPTPECDTKYLYHYLRYVKIPDAGYSRHYKFLKELWVPLPEISEQRRIAAILDKADSLCARRRQAIAKLDQLRQSLFIDMFGDPSSNPLGWPISSLAELGSIQTGKTPPTSVDGLFGGDIPFVTPGDLIGDVSSSERTITEAGAEYAKVVRAGAALVCCIGNIGKIAKTSVSCSFNQQINAIEWNVSMVDDEYGAVALTFQKSQMLALSSATTVPILNKTGFSKVSIPIPPLSLQKKFAERVGAITKVLSQNRSQMSRMELLFFALQGQAFEGDGRDAW